MQHNNLNKHITGQAAQLRCIVTRYTAQCVINHELILYQVRPTYTKPVSSEKSMKQRGSVVPLRSRQYYDHKVISATQSLQGQEAAIFPSVIMIEQCQTADEVFKG